MIAAYRAGGIAPELELAELHGPGVVEQQPADERRTRAEYELQCFGGLNRTDDAGEHAKDAAFGAARHESWRRRLGIQAPVAGSADRRKHRRLPFEAEDAAVGVGNLEEHARVVDEIPRSEVVGAIEDDVVALEELECIRRGQARLVGLDMHLGVDRGQAVASGLQLRAADVRRPMQNLSLQIAFVDVVEIDDAERADTGGGKIKRGGRPEASRTHAQHAPALDAALPIHADLGQDEVTAVALNLGVAQLGRSLGRRRAGAPPATDGTMLMTSPGLSLVASRSRYRMSSSFT